MGFCGIKPRVDCSWYYQGLQIEMVTWVRIKWWTWPDPGSLSLTCKRKLNTSLPTNVTPPPPKHQWRAFWDGVHRLSPFGEKLTGIWAHFTDCRSLHMVCTGLPNPKQDSRNGSWKELQWFCTTICIASPSRKRIWEQSIPSTAETAWCFQVSHQPLPPSREWASWELLSMLRTLPDLKKWKKQNHPCVQL